MAASTTWPRPLTPRSTSAARTLGRITSCWKRVMNRSCWRRLVRMRTMHGCLCGPGCGEQNFRLRPWSDINLQLGIITLEQTKSGHVQHVQLTDKTIELLKHMSSRFTPWLFPSISDPRKPMDGSVFSNRIFNPAVRKARLAEKGITVHTLRHTSPHASRCRGWVTAPLPSFCAIAVRRWFAGTRTYGLRT